MDSLIVALTTCPGEDVARKLGELALDAGAACVQIEGPIRSLYTWEGRRQEAAEWRLVVKVAGHSRSAVREAVQAGHPYSVPQWIELRADFVAEKYLQWAGGGR